ncbi:MAG TPA: universal stress protein [Polyangiaceae bacterium]
MRHAQTLRWLDDCVMRFVMAQPFRKILVATDFGPSSDRAVETAAALATRFAAELAVVHVVQEMAYAYPFPPPAGVRDEARAALEGVVSSLRARMLQVNGALREGVAWHEVVAAAADLEADLVVIGSQGRQGLQRFVMGSVAERVVRLSPVPVLTVHPYDEVALLAGGMDRFRNILAPTDLSNDSRRGLELAASLAREGESALTVVHVIEPFWEPLTRPYSLPPDIALDVQGAAQRQLDALVASVCQGVQNVEALTTVAKPWRSILSLAEEQRADLVVMSTGGRRGVQRVLIGSVAEKIVRLATIPVISVGPERGAQD